MKVSSEVFEGTSQGKSKGQPRLLAKDHGFWEKGDRLHTLQGQGKGMGLCTKLTAGQTSLQVKEVHIVFLLLLQQ